MLSSEKREPNKFIVSKIKMKQVCFITLALLSFFPSLVFVLMFLFLLGFLFRDAGIRYIFFFGSLLFLTLISMMLQEDYFYKGPIISFLFLLPFLLSFILLKDKSRSEYFLLFLKVHIFISLIQIPLQLIQFISVYGFEFGLVLSNSSAGDIGFGSLYNSFVLADKQILSMFFLISLKDHFSVLYVRLGLLALFFSFLFIGANTTTLVLLLSVIIYYLILTNLKLYKLKYMWKRVLTVSALLLAFFVVNKFFFTSQYQHVIGGINKVIENISNIGKVKAYGTIAEIYSDNPEYLFCGLGSGYYSSRVSFILSGEYLWQGEHALLGLQHNRRFDHYLRPLWNDNIRFNNNINGTIFQPFSGIVTIFSEYGLIVLLAFIAAMVNLYMRIPIDLGRIFIIFSFGMMFIDNFLEYPRILTPAIVYILYLLNQSKGDANMKFIQV